MLIDIDKAMVAHVKSIYSRMDNVTYGDGTRVALSLVEDEHTHHRLIERRSNETSKEVGDDEENRRFPFVILVRKSHTSRLNSASSSKAVIRDIEVISNSATGACIVADAKQLTLEYSIHHYTTSFEELTRMYEYWLLNIGHMHTHMEFSFSEIQIASFTIDGGIVYEEPSIVSQSVKAVEEEGTIFVQEFPLKLDTVLVGNIRDQNEIIKTVELSIDAFRVDEEFPF